MEPGFSSERLLDRILRLKEKSSVIDWGGEQEYSIDKNLWNLLIILGAEDFPTHVSPCGDGSIHIQWCRMWATRNDEYSAEWHKKDFLIEMYSFDRCDWSYTDENKEIKYSDKSCDLVQAIRYKLEYFG